MSAVYVLIAISVVVLSLAILTTEHLMHGARESGHAYSKQIKELRTQQFKIAAAHVIALISTI